jgi:hypothetical protein
MEYLIENVNISDLLPGDALKISVEYDGNSDTKIVKGIGQDDNFVLYAFNSRLRLIAYPKDNEICVQAEEDSSENLTINLTVQRVSVRVKYLPDSLLPPLYDTTSSEYSIRGAIAMLSAQLSRIDSWIQRVIESEDFNEAKDQAYNQYEIPYLLTEQPEIPKDEDESVYT